MALRRRGSERVAAMLPAGGALASHPLALLYLLDVPPWTCAPGAPLPSSPDGVPGPHERDAIRRSARRCRAVRAQPARKPS
ncbi:hypothetical protein [Burkholderia lata]|uniref:hypothetical protein n=1 Tax=Burkholderia lata (strain ATCC 17760 / DSM 23089 / LMG 22485 / NCIMB 9086 / R18194 / 383) TaxID=482957 RepID=UPI0020C623A3|nr:hypothetical protein [Burkholderia lata]